MIFFLISFFALFSWHLNANQDEWIIPERPAVYLFAPGIYASERQMVKYCGTYQASSGQMVSCDNDFIVINKPHCAVNFPEIALSHHQKSTYFYQRIGLRALLNYCMSTIWNYRQAFHDNRDHITIENSEAPNSIKYYKIAMEHINFGQEGDIQRLSETYDDVIAHYPDHDIVLFGVSRGAAAALTFLGTEYLNKETQRIKGVICESSFDSFDNLLALKLRHRLFQIPGVQWLFYKSFSLLFPSYKTNGINPLESARTIPHFIPILFVSSRSDTLVPPQCTESIYNAMKNNGHDKVHQIVLERSEHPRYSNDNRIDAHYYQSAVHDFYKKYNLSYNPKFASANDLFLDQ